MKLHRLFLAISIIGIYGLIVNNSSSDIGTNGWLARTTISLVLTSIGLVSYTFSE